MILQGRRPRIFGVEPLLSVDDDSINNLSGSGNGLGGGGSMAAVTTNGSGRTNLDVLFDAAVARPSSSVPSSSGVVAAGGRGRNGAKASSGSSGGSGDGGGGGGGGEGVTKADVGALLRTMEEGVSAPGGVGPLEWDWLSCEEAGDRARKLYREAAHAQVRMVHTHRSKVVQGLKQSKIIGADIQQVFVSRVQDEI